MQDAKRQQTEQALRQYAGRLEVLREVDRAILAAHSSEAIAQAALHHIGQLAPCRQASVVMFDFENRQGVVLASCRDGETEAGTGTRVPLKVGSAAGPARSEARVVDDTLTLPRPSPADQALQAEGIRSYINVSLVSQDELIGALIVGADRPGAFAPEHVDIARDVADLLAIAIHQAQLREQLQRRARVLAALNKASQAMTGTLDPQQVLRLVIAEVRSLLDAEGASVFLHEPATHELAFAASAGPSADELIGTRLPDTAGFAGWVLREKQAVLISDAHSDPRFYDRIDAMTGLTTRSILCVPLMIKGAICGVVEAINKASGAFTERDLETLEMMAASAAIAIENAHLYQAEREQFRRMQESQAQLIQFEKMAALGRLVASITHEINNPLQAVQGCLELAKEELDSGPRREKMSQYLGVAGNEIDRIADIVRRLREFYRPARPGFQATDVNAVLDSVLDLAGKQLQTSNIAVARAWADNLPTLWANPDHLKQVFLNLTLNAIDAMSAKGGTLRVRTSLDETLPHTGYGDQPPPMARIEFSDTGEGIPPEVMARLFEPFTTTKKDGTGLGLSISYGIIQAHGGQITVTSQAGTGTTFTILLPAEHEPPDLKANHAL